VGRAKGYQAPVYDGMLYSVVFDRQLRGLHERVAAWIEPGSTCLDACCGTGGVAFQLATKCERVVGVDISARMIDRADELRRRRGLDHVSFRVGDVSAMSPGERFDVATVAMGLHEMPTEARARVLPALLEVAPVVVIADFAVPMPWNLAGLRNRVIELSGGRRHFAGFRDYVRRGGLPTLIEQAGARIERQRLRDRGALLQVEVRR